MILGRGLRSARGFQGQNSAGVIERDLGGSGDVEIPFGTGFSPNPVVTDPYPFTGSGFSASRQGRLTPEYRVSGGDEIVPPEAAHLFELKVDGTKTLRAIFQGGASVAQ